MAAIAMTALPAYAQNEVVSILEKPLGGKIEIVEEYRDDELSGFFEVRYSAAAEELTLFDVLEEGLLEHQESINISSFRIPATEAGAQTVLDALCDVIYGNYEIICATGFLPYHSGGIITRIEPHYILDSKEADETARAEMDAKIDMYLEVAAEAPDFVGKMLVIHDEMARRCRYATAELNEFNEKKQNGESLTGEDYSIYTAYRLLLEDNAVCQGNAIALNAIYTRLAKVCGEDDFESAFCYNDGHVWNMIKLGGEWYHLDETWNDPDVGTKDADGNIVLADKCLHDYFMVSDSSMQDHSPAEWGYYCYDGEAIACDDTRYESGHIFSGKNEYGGWFGNIAYKNGRYVVDVWALRMYDDTVKGVICAITGYPMFYSNTVKSYGLIASDVDTSESNGTVTKSIRFFANEEISEAPNVRGVLYQGDQLLKIGKWNIDAIGECEITNNLSLPITSYKLKLFAWKNGTQQPLCEGIEIK